MRGDQGERGHARFPIDESIVYKYVAPILRTRAPATRPKGFVEAMHFCKIGVGMDLDDVLIVRLNWLYGEGVLDQVDHDEGGDFDVSLCYCTRGICNARWGRGRQVVRGLPPIPHVCLKSCVEMQRSFNRSLPLTPRVDDVVAFRLSPAGKVLVVRSRPSWAFLL